MNKTFLFVVMILIFGNFLAAGNECKPTDLYDGYSEAGGWSIGSPYDSGSHYSISYACKNNKCDRLYLELLLYNDEKGCVHHKMISHIVIPETKQDEIIAVGCSVSGVPNPEVVAIVKQTAEEKHTNIVHAWRANRRLKKFEKISTQGIACINAGFGV